MASYPLFLLTLSQILKIFLIKQEIIREETQLPAEREHILGKEISVFG